MSVIPELVDIGASWNVLPPGVHNATFKEVEDRFATDRWRQKLFRGLLQGSNSLKSAGCTAIYLDGSFVTDKPTPGDYEVCWNPLNVDPTKLDPILLTFDNQRSKQKSKYGGEYFPSSARADGSQFFVRYFQRDKETGLEKGIIRIQL